jgi:hypothetical protein
VRQLQPCSWRDAAPRERSRCRPSR